MGVCRLIRRVVLEQWRKEAEGIDLHGWFGSDYEGLDEAERARGEAIRREILGLLDRLIGRL